MSDCSLVSSKGNPQDVRRVRHACLSCASCKTCPRPRYIVKTQHFGVRGCVGPGRPREGRAGRRELGPKRASSLTVKTRCPRKRSPKVGGSESRFGLCPLPRIALHDERSTRVSLSCIMTDEMAGVEALEKGGVALVVGPQPRHAAAIDLRLELRGLGSSRVCHGLHLVHPEIEQHRHDLDVHRRGRRRRRG